ncbi:hypothetical protein MNEG_13694 [Monoraphidium neglectum]|uniref:Uncharacterized protein n=1 Tax=Monoraphidium neglectum TaxID=145388 RepID=A0A0D2J2R4_9CHLO|nr:hypothetical protein MNEG_13694 [Monoraphidium neglectum]KIY94267.1 hypothetical protein MNEG_13694 [Monoraphidium neglectum]|eukprot:XP_013893287.1 hypothetical protein MNEG_13694 [Monoraphidium neglectum]
MTNLTQYNPVQDDISLPENKCGVIMSVDMDENWSGTKSAVLLAGNKKANTDSNNSCNTEAISEPDNVHYVANTLIINEDTGNHLNNVAWAYDLDSGNLTRILSSPKFAEVTGIWASRIGDKVYLSMGIQHPMEDEDAPLDAPTKEEFLARQGYLGYLGPLPASILSPDVTLEFEGIPKATGDDINKVVATTKVCVKPSGIAIASQAPYRRLGDK